MSNITPSQQIDEHSWTDNVKKHPNGFTFEAGGCSFAKSGGYVGIVDFIKKNGLEQRFIEDVSGDRTIEKYLEEYGETQELTQGIISDLSDGISWRVKFHSQNQGISF